MNDKPQPSHRTPKLLRTAIPQSKRVIDVSRETFIVAGMADVFQNMPLRADWLIEHLFCVRQYPHGWWIGKQPPVAA